MRLPLPLLRAAVLAGSRPLGAPVPVPVQRAWLSATSVLGRLPPGTSVARSRLGDRPAEVVRPAGAASDRCLLLLHGGAFVTGSPRTHRVFAAHLALATGRVVHVLDQRLAPEHPHPAALDDADRALAELQAQGPVDVVGDSAGGTLALLLALRCRDEGSAPPRAVVAVSPLADLTLASSDAYRGRDPLLRRSWVRDGVAHYLGGADPRALSPLARDLHGLPPLLVQVSEHERLRPEGERLVAAVRAAGGTVDLQVLAGLWHDPHVYASLVPEAAGAVRDIGCWLDQVG